MQKLIKFLSSWLKEKDEEENPKTDTEVTTPQ